ncbi:MAG: DoxX family membrane protein [Gemmatimonadales bacterium]|nr:DoxX family membrane protein [Gemmatimonadales bacterium]NIN11118.1 DoxX family membrane protein [Gemmatimonadales bacterium]NIN49715.1 DoxX family membrane protein [Gemmatimonadales bacterium]NIP07179.1 DoxX family membrane protein [Gemmatimonadales bacterium]NIQ99571.1 DoxX family membrane protein [Gemmatimonadales bacterium]
MPEQLFPWMQLIGRILFSMMFIGSGMMRLFKLNDMAAYAQTRGAPAPKAATVVTGLIMLVGGVLVLLGWHRFIGAGLIAIVVLLTAFTLHGFWKETDPVVKQNEMSHFLKDLALCGAALLVAVYAGIEWPMSLGG